MLNVIDSLSAHYHEHHDVLMAWPWKLFCAKWARMTVALAKQDKEREDREIERRQHEMERAAY